MKTADEYAEDEALAKVERDELRQERDALQAQLDRANDQYARCNADRERALTERHDMARRLEAEQRAHAETADKLAQVQASLQRQVGA